MNSRTAPWTPEMVAAALRRRRRRIQYAKIALACVIASIVFEQAKAMLFGSDDWSAFDGRPMVIAGVLDAQTISVHRPDSSSLIAVRLLGVASGGVEWDSHAKSLLAGNVGRTVTLHLEPLQTRDSRGQLLAYVYLDDRDMLNADLIRLGFARVDRKSTYAFRGELATAQGEAKRKRIGVWTPEILP